LIPDCLTRPAGCHLEQRSRAIAGRLTSRRAQVSYGQAAGSSGRKIVNTEGLFRGFVQDSGDAMVWCDASGNIQLWNRAAERVFGYAESEAIGRYLDITIPERRQARHWEGYRKTMQTGKSSYGAGDLLPVPAVRKDGGRISIEFSVVMLCDLEARIVAIGAIIRDVIARFEELKHLRKQLATAGGARPRRVRSRRQHGRDLGQHRLTMCL
jgi:PAS domain S-box-containing protein